MANWRTGKTGDVGPGASDNYRWTVESDCSAGLAGVGLAVSVSGDDCYSIDSGGVGEKAY